MKGNSSVRKEGTTFEGILHLHPIPNDPRISYLMELKDRLIRYRPPLMDPNRPTVFQGNDHVDLTTVHFACDLVHRVERTEIFDFDG